MVQSETQGEFRRIDLRIIEPVRLIQEARTKGLLVFAKDDKLIVRGPKDAGTDLVQVLLQRKAELMVLLQHWDADAWEQFEERVAIAQADGGQSLPAAERLAWDEVQSARLVTE
jgi:hypothetical protein